MDFSKKYIKYKRKYIELKNNMKGGDISLLHLKDIDLFENDVFGKHLNPSNGFFVKEKNALNNYYNMYYKKTDDGRKILTRSAYNKMAINFDLSVTKNIKDLTTYDIGKFLAYRLLYKIYFKDIFVDIDLKIGKIDSYTKDFSAYIRSMNIMREITTTDKPLNMNQVSNVVFKLNSIYIKFSNLKKEKYEDILVKKLSNDIYNIVGPRDDVRADVGLVGVRDGIIVDADGPIVYTTEEEKTIVTEILHILNSENARVFKTKLEAIKEEKGEDGVIFVKNILKKTISLIGNRHTLTEMENIIRKNTQYKTYLENNKNNGIESNYNNIINKKIKWNIENTSSDMFHIMLSLLFYKSDNGTGILRYYEGILEVLDNIIDIPKNFETTIFTNSDLDVPNYTIVSDFNLATAILYKHNKYNIQLPSWSRITVTEPKSKRKIVFSDCGESSVRAFIMLLISKNDGYDFSVLEDLGAIPEIRTFFETFNYVSQNDYGVKKIFRRRERSSKQAWSLVIDNIEGVKYNQHITYNEDGESKKYFYELSSQPNGEQINFIVLLTKIFTNVLSFEDLKRILATKEIIISMIDKGFPYMEIEIHHPTLLDFVFVVEMGHYHVDSKSLNAKSIDLTSLTKTQQFYLNDIDIHNEDLTQYSSIKKNWFYYYDFSDPIIFTKFINRVKFNVNFSDEDYFESVMYISKLDNDYVDYLLELNIHRFKDKKNGKSHKIFKLIDLRRYGYFNGDKQPTSFEEINTYHIYRGNIGEIVSIIKDIPTIKKIIDPLDMNRSIESFDKLQQIEEINFGNLFLKSVAVFRKMYNLKKVSFPNNQQFKKNTKKTKELIRKYTEIKVLIMGDYATYFNDDRTIREKVKIR
jgi:hypothetical protein